MKKQVGSFLAGRGLMMFLFFRSGVTIASPIYEGMLLLVFDIFTISYYR